jgi:hypothetical protein
MMMMMIISSEKTEMQFTRLAMFSMSPTGFLRLSYTDDADILFAERNCLG